MAKLLIAYLRVSTKMQGQSGLGLEAQRAAVEAYAKQTGAVVAGWYTEVETGKKSDKERPKLAQAMAHTRRSKATLCIAKLDRLSRNVAFISTLMESKVPFVAVDNPHANTTIVHFLAVMAEDEARRISERTKAALAAYKARGGLLGAQLAQCRNLTPQARLKGGEMAAKAHARAAMEAYADIVPMVAELRQGGETLEGIAAELNTQGHTTRRGRPWNPVQVSRVLARL